PKFDHTPDEGGLRVGYTECTLPTEYPSVALGDLMMHTRRRTSRRDRDQVQDIGPRLQQNGGDYKQFPEYPEHIEGALREPSKNIVADPQCDAKHDAPTREPPERSMKHEP